MTTLPPSRTRSWQKNPRGHEGLEGFTILFIGAGNEARTRDLNLGKIVPQITQAFDQEKNYTYLRVAQ